VRKRNGPNRLKKYSKFDYLFWFVSWVVLIFYESIVIRLSTQTLSDMKLNLSRIWKLLLGTLYFLVLALGFLNEIKNELIFCYPYLLPTLLGTGHRFIPFYQVFIAQANLVWWYGWSYKCGCLATTNCSVLLESDLEHSWESRYRLANLTVY